MVEQGGAIEAGGVQLRLGDSAQLQEQVIQIEHRNGGYAGGFAHLAMLPLWRVAGDSNAMLENNTILVAGCNHTPSA